MNKRWNYFTDEEVKGLDAELVAKLDWARKRSGAPFIITSGLRTEGSNEMVGGVGNSSHIRGLAVDLKVSDSITRFRMVQALLLVGFKRIGVYNHHLHVDMDSTLPQEVMWLGESK